MPTKATVYKRVSLIQIDRSTVQESKRAIERDGEREREREARATAGEFDIINRRGLPTPRQRRYILCNFTGLNFYHNFLRYGETAATSSSNVGLVFYSSLACGEPPEVPVCLFALE